jgi:hypothetical protein
MLQNVWENDEGETWRNEWEVNKIGRRVRDVIADGDVLDCGLDLWNVPLFQVLGLSTPLAPEQRATSRSSRPFLISVHVLPGAE